MRCPGCGGSKHRVTETRVSNRRFILRRRRCPCGNRFKTVESVTEFHARTPRQGLPLDLRIGKNRIAKGGRVLYGPGGEVVITLREQEVLEEIAAAWPNPVEKRIVWKRVWGSLPVKDGSASWQVSKLGRSLRKVGVELRAERRRGLKETWYSLRELVK